MRHVVTKIDEPILLRAGEVNWMPISLDGYTYHLLVNDEDFQLNKSHKLSLRRFNRRLKLNSKYQ